MSGKQIVLPWAVETNYPAGGNLWNGNPLKVAPSGDYWTPNTKPPAEQRNYLDAQIKTDIQNLSDFTSCDIAQNWHAPFVLVGSIGTGGVPSAASYDAVNDRWLFAISKVTTGGNLLIATTDAVGGALVPLGDYVATTENAISCLKDPTDAFTYYTTSYSSGGGLASVFRYDSSVGSPAWAVSYANGSTNVYDMKVSAFGGKIQAYVGGGAGVTPLIRYSSDKGLTWTTAGYTPGVNVFAWNVKAGPNEVLALPVQIAGSTPLLARSTDGHTFAQVNLSGIGSTDVLIDLANLGGSTWLLVAQTASSGIYFRKSVDGGLTWSAAGVVTSRNTGIPAGGQAASPVLCAFGQLVVCLVKLSGTSQSVIFSTDGGTTWHSGLNTNTATNAYSIQPGLAQSSCQLVIVNNTQVQFSHLSGPTSLALT